MDDSQIIGLFFRREQEAVAQLQQKYNRLCESIARRIVPDRRDVEECVSDAYLHVWNAMPPDNPRSLQAYLARITRNLALDRYSYNSAGLRSTALTDAFDELEGCLCDPDGNPEQIAESKDFESFVNRFLRALPHNSRVYFIRRYWYGESIDEIAAACGVGAGGVKSSLFRTRAKLKEAMEKEQA